MNNSLDTHIVLKQQLILSQKVMDELKILQMSDLELKQFIDTCLEANPILELEETYADKFEELFEKEKVVAFDISDKGPIADDESYNRDFTCYTKTPFTLKEHLRLQIGEIKLQNDIHALASYIIENIDTYGYLAVSANRIATELNVPNIKIDEALRVVHTLEPAGVGARDLKECILLQLARSSSMNPTVKIIVNDYLEQLGLRKYKEIAKLCGLNQEQVKRIHDLIKHTDPKPGLKYHSSSGDLVLPELFLRLENGTYIVEFINDYDVHLTISDYYKKLYKESSGEVKEFLNSKFSEASRIIEGIRKRKMTILNIASFIVQHQTEFFEKGKLFIKPLTMKAVADALVLHESTISRTVNNKFIQTPSGMFELKYFFSAKLMSENTAISSEAIKSAVSQIVLEEDKTRPFTDEGIRRVLLTKGFVVKRRTIAKYRKELSILSSNLRKRF